jgi:hypothetical protein
MPEGISGDTMKMLSSKPELLRALADNPRAAKVLTLCRSLCIPDFATPDQLAKIERLVADAESHGLEIDNVRLKEYFRRPTDLFLTSLRRPCGIRC